LPVPIVEAEVAPIGSAQTTASFAHVTTSGEEVPIDAESLDEEVLEEVEAFDASAPARARRAARCPTRPAPPRRPPATPPPRSAHKPEVEHDGARVIISDRSVGSGGSGGGR
jgi:hypothetical protein